MTTLGGTLANGCGAQCDMVFEVTPPNSQSNSWTETLLYDFQGVNVGEGDCPLGGLIWGMGDKLYGTTAYGGSGNCVLPGGHVGCGTVYEPTGDVIVGEEEVNWS